MPAPHDPLGAFRDEAVFLLEEALHSLRQEEARAAVRATLVPAPAGKGDFTYAVFPLAKAMRKAPPAIAAEIAAAIPASPRLNVTVEGPYINFAADPAALAGATIASVTERGLLYGTRPSTGKSVIVEHTSANPNGPFHVGRARNPIVGDSLARIIRAAGNDVTTEYYVNDVGKQVAILAWGLQNLKPSDVPPAERQKADHQRVAYYQKANELQEKDPKVAAEITASLAKFEAGDLDVATGFREAAGQVLSGMRESLARMNVEMDRYSWESEYIQNGSVQPVIEKLKKSPLAHQDESGSWYLDLASHGIAGRSQRWTFMRSNGTSLYTTRDIAYHLDKFQRAERVVNVLGEDHKLTMQQLDIALDVVADADAGERTRPDGRVGIGAHRHPEIVWISFVSLPEGKMSTRRNRVVFIDDLMDEAVARAREEVEKRRAGEIDAGQMDKIAEIVGIGALRFNIARVQSEKSITFRWEEALDFEGDSAPYIMYSHARAASILRKAAEEGVQDAAQPRFTEPSERALVTAIARFPSVVALAASDLRVHNIAQYASELANAFNQFYRDCPVLIAPEPARASRVVLTRAAKQTLANALGLLGVVAPDSM